MAGPPVWSQGRTAAVRQLYAERGPARSTDDGESAGRFVGVGEPRLDVEYGGSVEEVDACEVDDVAVHAPVADEAQADRVGSLRCPGREHALYLAGGLGRPRHKLQWRGGGFFPLAAA